MNARMNVKLTQTNLGFFFENGLFPEKYVRFILLALPCGARAGGPSMDSYVYSLICGVPWHEALLCEIRVPTSFIVLLVLD